MDTPVKSFPAASTSSPNPVSQFEDSPIFKYINNLSPIKPLNSDQSFNLLSFASPKTPFTSPAIDCPQKSKTTCSQLPYPLKPEPADGENVARKSQVIDNLQPIESLAGKEDYHDSSFGLKDNASHELSESAVDACQSTNNEPGISQIETDGKEDCLDSGMVVRVESAPDEPAELSIEPHQCISSVHGGCDCKADDPCPQQQEMLPSRCLIFEMSGTHYKKLMSENAGASLISEQSVCTAVTSEKRLVSSKCEVYNSMLPGIGLHLNTLARREKIVVKQEISTYKRQLISIPCTTSSLNSTSSDPKPIDPALNIDPMQENSEPSNNEGNLKEIASQSSAFTGSVGVKQNSTKRKRCKSENVEGDNTCKRCNCKRSKCLKLYCECFAAGLYCVDPCACQGCLNKPAFEETVLETRRLIEARNPLAFAPKVIRIPDATEYREELNKTPASARHKTGCNCKKSGCLKKYCECFQGGVGCSLSCRCEGCKNSYGRKDGINDFILEVTEDNSADADFPEAVLNVEMEDDDLQVTPISQIGRNPSGLVGLDSQFPSFSSRLLQPCANHGLAKITSFSCNDTLGVPPLRKMTIEDDETAKGLKDDNATLTPTSVKSTSPNSKRVSPHLEPRHSPPRKFSRKLILRSIPSFPRLPEHSGNTMSQEKP